MPLYRCTAPARLISVNKRQEIASEFTRIHSQVTGAPVSFVHVHFIDREGSDSPDMKRCEIHGTVRAGRSAEVITQLVDQLTRAFGELAVVAPGDISVVVAEVPASWIMEGGIISPEPGEEGEWLKGHLDSPAG